MSKSGKSGKFSLSKIVGIIVIIIVFLAASFFSILDGIVNTVVNFFKGLVGGVIDAATTLWEGIQKFFGVSVIKNGMYIYSINQDEISALKQQIKSKGVDTDKAGITDVMLRKILLTQAVTSSTKDTICVAQIKKDEILKDTGYKDLKKYLKNCDKKKSKDIWPIDDYNYDLYYITDHFFYFKDEDDIMQKGSDQYYLGIMGQIDIKSDEGDDLSYVSQTEFEKAMQNYKNLSDDKKPGSQEEYDLLHKYTIDSNGQNIVYKIVENTNIYKYVFTNSSTNTEIEEKVQEGNSTYDIISVPLDIQGSVDTSQYAISVELLINLLNLSASPEYLDEFMDYALDKSKITITGYQLNDEEISYSKNTYNIKDSFIFELYDMVNVADSGGDNIKTYKPLIYDRLYKGRPFEYSVVNLSDFENIDYEMDSRLEAAQLYEKILAYQLEQEPENIKQYLEEQGYDTEDKVRNYIENYNYFNEEMVSTDIKDDLSEYIFNGKLTVSDSNVKKISEYLLSAYDPPSEFSLGDILGQEIEINRRTETSWKFCISSISTWFGNITYESPTKSKEFYTDSIKCTKDLYNAFNENSLTEYESINEDDNKTKIYISKARAEEIGISGDENVIVVDNEDIFDNVLMKDIRRRERD